MGHVYIACACDEHYAGDALACAQAIASGTTTPCGCACHTARELGDPVAVLEEQLAVASKRCEMWKARASKWQELAEKYQQLSDIHNEGLREMHGKLLHAYKEISTAVQALRCGLDVDARNRLEKLLLEQ